MRIREDLAPLRRRATAAFAVMLAGLALLGLRLAQLQLLDGEHWRRMAENNRLRRLPVEAARGRIYDRSGNLLADNLPAFRLLLYPDEARTLDRTLLFLRRDVGLELNELPARLARGTQWLAPVVVAEGLSWHQVAVVRSHQSDYPELSVVSGVQRVYPDGPLTAHVVGHLRLVSQEELASRPELGPDTLVGASGVEALVDRTLAGHDGERRLVVSAVGRQLGLLGEVPPRPGIDVTLTLDAGLQRVAAEALGSYAGAVVALDPRTGAVRVLYSAPSFNPELFTGRLSRAEWSQLRDDPGHPLQDRCVQGLYPPGSTIKPFYALAALSSGAVSPGFTVNCHGGISLHGSYFRCWVRSGHGRVGFRRSLEVSCDTFYYTLGQRLGIETMASWLRRFGFGSLTGLGFAGERDGLVGTPEWSQRVRGEPWYPGTTVSYSIGQGPLLVTPLQLARGFALFANGGRLVQPYLVERSDRSAGSELELDPHALEIVRQGLELVVHGSEGTARRLAALPVAGKTGTAQVAALREGVSVQELEERLRHHALFVGWGPVDDPTLVVAVVVEHGGSGGGVAAPVAEKVLRAGLLGLGGARGPTSAPAAEHPATLD